MAKRMRLPNGFGQISKLKQRLRNPYRAMVTESWTDEGKPVRKIVGYYHTYNEAYSALMEYHSDPLAFERGMDMEELFEKWSAWYYPQLKGEKAGNIHNAAWNHHCMKLYHVPVKEIRAYHIKETVEADMPPSMHKKVHTLLNLMLDYAVEYELTDKNYSRIANPFYEYQVDDKAHVAYSEDEIMLLWNNLAVPCVEAALVQIYTGMRPQELARVKIKEIDVSTWTIVGGMKTEAGRNRTIPIHAGIRPIIEKMIEDAGDSEYLLGGIVYDTYRRRFVKMCNKLGISRSEPHNCRKTFITLAKKYNVNEYAIKRIVGHSVKDITEAVYTERDIEWLHEEIDKIPVRFGNADVNIGSCRCNVDLDKVYRGLLEFNEI